MNQHKKLTSRQHTEEQQLTAGHQHTQQPASLEFANPEEMLRHDALHTPVPPPIAARLQESIARQPTPARPWWRRLLGR